MGGGRVSTWTGTSEEEMTNGMTVFHHPEIEGKRLVSFFVSEPTGYIQLVFEDGFQVQIGATMAVVHPSLAHGAGQILVTAKPDIHTFANGAEKNLREACGQLP